VVEGKSRFKPSCEKFEARASTPNNQNHNEQWKPIIVYFNFVIPCRSHRQSLRRFAILSSDSWFALRIIPRALANSPTRQTFHSTFWKSGPKVPQTGRVGTDPWVRQRTYGEPVEQKSNYCGSEISGMHIATKTRDSQLNFSEIWNA
jgi:hypothetical protein